MKPVVSIAQLSGKKRGPVADPAEAAEEQTAAELADELEE
jgi:hypothetical protein